jgi:hypothetical protein
MTLAEAKAKYNENGGHFFDRDTMRFFGSRIESDLYKNRCFITSEKNFDGTKRFYTVRRFNKDFTSIDTIGEFNKITSKHTAQQIAKEVE